MLFRSVHERRFLEQWQSAGRRVVEIRSPHEEGDWGRAAEETRAAMHAGADVIYQGVFVEAPWRGIADFLVKCDTPSDLGAWSYEAWDTKLASRAKPAFVLQLAFYSEQLARLQGTAPEQMHIVPGTGKTESFRVAHFGAYYRRVRQRLLRTLETQPATAPYPVSHCRVCHYADACTAQWQQIGRAHV